MSTIEKAAARLVKRRQPGDDSSEGFYQGEPVGSITEKATLEAEAPLLSDSLGGTPTPLGSQSKPVNTGAQGYLKTCEMDLETLRAAGFLVPQHENLKQSQEFRRIKRQLLVNLQESVRKDCLHPTNVIYITSALPGEGKTFVSMNLALSLAGELDRTVLLVDGDAAKGDLSRWTGIHDEPGLVDLLVNKNGYSESSVIATNVEHLSVMSCGIRTDNLDELYASELMEGLLAGMAARDPNRIIVIDGPPLLATTEAAVLARLMGQTVVVVEANKTPQAAVTQAVSQIARSQLVSLLLNKAASLDSSQYGGYGYGYGYGHREVQQG